MPTHKNALSIIYKSFEIQLNVVGVCVYTYLYLFCGSRKPRNYAHFKFDIFA